MAPRPDIFTKHGYLLPEVVSALQKAMRRCDEEAAVYWAAEMAMSGYSEYCWSRLKVILSEDIGPAAPGLPADFRALYENWKEMAKKGTDPLPLIHAVLLLARAKKSTVVIDAVVWGYEASATSPRREIPDEAYDKHTKRGRQMGRGYVHFIENGGVVYNEDLTQLNDNFRKANVEWSIGKDDPSKALPVLNPEDPYFVPPGGRNSVMKANYQPPEPALLEPEEDEPEQAALTGFDAPSGGRFSDRLKELSQERDLPSRKALREEPDFID